jgi:hypothetical protein
MRPLLDPQALPNVDLHSDVTQTTKTIRIQATKSSRLIANNSSTKVWHGYLLRVIGAPDFR